MKTIYSLFTLSMVAIIGYIILVVWSHQLFDHQSIHVWSVVSHNQGPEILLILESKKDSVEIERIKVTQKTEKITYRYNKYIKLSYIVSFSDSHTDTASCELQKELNLGGTVLSIGIPETIFLGEIRE